MAEGGGRRKEQTAATDDLCGQIPRGEREEEEKGRPFLGPASTTNAPGPQKWQSQVGWRGELRWSRHAVAAAQKSRQIAVRARANRYKEFPLEWTLGVFFALLVRR